MTKYPNPMRMTMEEWCKARVAEGKPAQNGEYWYDKVTSDIPISRDLTPELACTTRYEAFDAFAQYVETGVPSELVTHLYYTARLEKRSSDMYYGWYPQYRPEGWEFDIIVPKAEV